MKTIILAGGRSSRMGENKALMKIGSQSVMERLIAELSPVSEEIIIVANEKEYFLELGVKVVGDDPSFMGQGPVAGLHAGLSAAGAGPCLVVACDMPFAAAGFGIELIRIMENNGLDAVIPTENGRMHPLFAAYGAHVARQAEEALAEGERSVKALLSRLNTEYFEAEKNTPVLWNMNTKEDYVHILNWLERREVH
ncbi:MAG TPA: molybdenum cofactor guanylyltransferase [Bacillaceae bacterium]